MAAHDDPTGTALPPQARTLPTEDRGLSSPSVRELRPRHGINSEATFALPPVGGGPEQMQSSPATGKANVVSGFCWGGLRLGPLSPWPQNLGGLARLPAVWALTAALCLLPGIASAQDPGQSEVSLEEKVWQHRNLGKAFYENPATQYQAVDEFRRALELAPESARERLNYGLSLLRAGKTEEGVAELEKAQGQDPSIPHTWFNLGIEYQRAGRYEDAIRQLEGMAVRVPDEAITQYNLGVLYKLTGNREKALVAFRRSAELDPNLAGPHFQLATTLRQAKQLEQAKAEMEIFRRLKKRQAGAAVPEDLEWSWYSEILDEIEPNPAPGSPAPLRLVAKGSDSLGKARRAKRSNAILRAADFNGDGLEDVLAVSGRRSVLLGSAGGSTSVQRLDLDLAEGEAQIDGLDVGDFNNDNIPDLAVVTAGNTLLLRGTGKGFERAEGPDLQGRGDSRKNTAGKHAKGLPVWLDYDHDYDLDLLVFGSESPSSSKLWRNNGDGSWSDLSSDFPFAGGTAVAVTRLDVMADHQGFDLAVAYRDGPLVLYRDQLAGKYLPELIPLKPSEKMTGLYPGDFDNDGWTDLAVETQGPIYILLNDRSGAFQQRQVLGIDARFGPLAIADLEGRGWVDLISQGGWLRNRGLGRFERAELKDLEKLRGAQGVVTAELDGDGRPELVWIGTDGSLHWASFDGGPPNHWLRVSLKGVKNLARAAGAEVEIKAGSHYEKKPYTGSPLTFGLGNRRTVDTVRITWPNGLIQNESRQEVDRAVVFEEAQRLSGSCPMIFTWNGEGFQFITDVLGVAPLGASAGDGEYFPVDHDEWIQIPGDALVPGQGETEDLLEIRITEELREVAYLDEIRLVAVDHRAGTEVFTNDKFKGPPFPEFRLFPVEETDKLHPISARDHRGNEVAEALQALDRTYPDDYSRNYAGVAELHHLELDFGSALEPAGAEGPILVLSGWVDWADGSSFRGASQAAGPGLIMPYLQVKNADGEWQTILEDMGIPAGKPKTIVVDLQGLLPEGSHELRIVTNLCVYWDEIFVSRKGGSQAEQPAVLTSLAPQTAELRFRGFSKPIVHPERKQPEVFEYASRRDFTMWNPTRGLYTRYGDVKSLLKTTDDQYVIMGSGDELRLLFDAKALPPLPDGQTRSYLLFVDGWAKDGDANTAHSQTVGPLPYHGMPQYPFAAAPPDTEELRRWREIYNTRPGLRLIRPLVSPRPRVLTD